MIPTSWLTVVLFLFLIAPGLLFDLLAQRRRSSVTESAFREASRVILASIAFDSFAFLVLIGVQAVKPLWLPNPARMLRGGATYVADHYNLVLLAIMTQTLLAVGAAYAVHWALTRRDGESIRQVSAWTQVFRRDCPKGTKPFARVRLSGGTIYFGLVANFTADHNLESRELVLAPPLFAKASGDGKQLTPVPSEYGRVVLRGAAIEAISVEYRPDLIFEDKAPAEAGNAAVAGTSTAPARQLSDNSPGR